MAQTVVEYISPCTGLITIFSFMWRINLEGWPPMARAFQFVYLSTAPIIVSHLCFPCCCLSCTESQWPWPSISFPVKIFWTHTLHGLVILMYS